MDRNIICLSTINGSTVSLSARRAWIEITTLNNIFELFPVALRKESVDRNLSALPGKAVTTRSLSARRAWIEIFVPCDVIRPAIGRSPQGERG